MKLPAELRMMVYKNFPTLFKAVPEVLFGRRERCSSTAIVRFMNRAITLRSIRLHAHSGQSLGLSAGALYEGSLPHPHSVLG